MNYRSPLIWAQHRQACTTVPVPLEDPRDVNSGQDPRDVNSGQDPRDVNIYGDGDVPRTGAYLITSFI